MCQTIALGLTKEEPGGAGKTAGSSRHAGKRQQDSLRRSPLSSDGRGDEHVTRQDAFVGELQLLGLQAGVQQFRHECVFALQQSKPGAGRNSRGLPAVSP